MKSSPSLFERIEAASSEMTRSERLLAAAQVHATLAVEAAVRDLIETLATRSDGS